MCASSSARFYPSISVSSPSCLSPPLWAFSAVQPFWRPGCPSWCWWASCSQRPWPSTCGDLGEAGRGHGGTPPQVGMWGVDLSDNNARCRAKAIEEINTSCWARTSGARFGLWEAGSRFLALLQPGSWRESVIYLERERERERWLDTPTNYLNTLNGLWLLEA